MSVQTEKLGDVVAVVPGGKLWGGKETDEVENELRQLIQANQKKILLDLRNTSQINSVGIGMLVGIHTSAANRGLRFHVCNIERRIKNTLAILKLINVLNVFDTPDDAIDAFSNV